MEFHVSDAFKALGLEPTHDRRLVKKTYAARIKSLDPQRQPEQFQNVRQAYETILEYLDNCENPTTQNPENEVLEQSEWVRLPDSNPLGDVATPLEALNPNEQFELEIEKLLISCLPYPKPQRRLSEGLRNLFIEFSADRALIQKTQKWCWDWTQRRGEEASAFAEALAFIFDWHVSPPGWLSKADQQALHLREERRPVVPHLKEKPEKKPLFPGLGEAVLYVVSLFGGMLVLFIGWLIFIVPGKKDSYQDLSWKPLAEREIRQTKGDTLKRPEDPQERLAWVFDNRPLEILGQLDFYDKVDWETTPPWVFRCIKVGRPDVFDAMLQKGMVVHRQNARGETPLFYAVKYGRFDLLSRMIQLGEDPLDPGACGLSASQWCRQNQLEQVADWMESGAPDPPSGASH